MVLTRVIALVALATLLAGSGLAQQSEEGLSPARKAATEKRRVWLRKRLVDPVKDETRREAIRLKLDRLSPDEVEAAVNHYLERQQEARDTARRSRASSLSSQQQELDRATRVRDALANEVERRRRGATGFAPVISWLPDGVSLTASAVISPDGRYVRTSVNPFFSRVGPVDTFNFYGGGAGLYPGWFPGYCFGAPQYQYIEKRIYAGPIPAQPYHHGHHHHHHRGHGHGGQRPKIWYDGLRTRVGKH